MALYRSLFRGLKRRYLLVIEKQGISRGEAFYFSKLIAVVLLVAIVIIALSRQTTGGDSR
jgi:cell division protein FtsL